MKLNIVVEKESIGLQILDWLYAYNQSKNWQNNYKADIQIEFSDRIKVGYINVLYSNSCNSLENNIEDFDIVLLDNAGEQLEVSTPYIKQMSEEYSHVYMLTGGFVPKGHPLKHKIVSYNHCFHTFRRYYTDGFYPHFYDIKSNDYLDRKKNFYFINGENRSWRHHFAELLRSQCDFVDHHLEKSTTVVKTLDCQFESLHDQEFRDFVNENIPSGDDTEDFIYYNNSVSCGINGKFGNIVPGMFLLPAYCQYRCVVFPESSWINNEFYMTEKTFKCFVSYCFPLPIAGANTAKFYNDYGFYTALDLCPPELKFVDRELNHVKRHQGILECLQWLNKNLEVFTTDSALAMLESNYNNFHSCRLNKDGVTMLDKIFRTFNESK